MQIGNVALKGGLGLQVIRKDRWIPDSIRQFSPKSDLGKYVLACVKHLPRAMAEELVARVSRVVVIESSLALQRFQDAVWDGQLWNLQTARLCEDYGVVSRRVVTTAGVNFIVDAFQNSVELENLKYHGLGTGTNSEASGDTALQTELTTQYNPNSTRATGSLTEGASANIFRTVGTNTVDASAAVTEHGIFDQASTAGGTLLDRSVFSVINLASGDSLASTYDLTCAAGG